jgi:DNA helicase IV
LRKSLLDKLKLTDEQRKRVDISTTHKYKGKEKQVIIVLDADRYGNIHPDSIFNRIFGDDESKLFEDERRLLYVALTRAKNELFIVTDSFNSSPFIAGLTQTMQLKEVDWANYPVPMTGDRFILVRVSNQKDRGSSPTKEINEFLKSEGYRFDGNLICWYKVELIQAFLADGSRLQYLSDRNWSSQANGIAVNFCNEQEEILASYLANNGKWTCNLDRFKQSMPVKLDKDDYEELPWS